MATQGNPAPFSVWLVGSLRQNGDRSLRLKASETLAKATRGLKGPLTSLRKRFDTLRLGEKELDGMADVEAAARKGFGPYIYIPFSESS